MYAKLLPWTARHLHPINLYRVHARVSIGRVFSSTAKTPLAPTQFNVRRLERSDVDVQFARSGGAGGQNVNKVNTKVDMRFDLNGAYWIPEEVKDSIRKSEKNRFNKEGILIVTSTRHRTQAQNIDDALQKLQEILDAAVLAVTPKEVDPEVKARVERAIKVGKEKRLDSKKKDSMKKKERRNKDWS